MANRKREVGIQVDVSVNEPCGLPGVKQTLADSCWDPAPESTLVEVERSESKNPFSTTPYAREWLSKGSGMSPEPDGNKSRSNTLNEARVIRWLLLVFVR
jgi:hypothetical protein